MSEWPKDVAWVRTMLPHRYPMLLVDRVLKIETDKRIVAEKCVTINEEFFQGHFPGNPVMPGVLIIEGVAQAGGVLVMYEHPERLGRSMYLTSIDRARFRRPVVPGDRIRYEVEILKWRRNYCKLAGSAFVDDELAAEATLMSTVIED